MSVFISSISFLNIFLKYINNNVEIDYSHLKAFEIKLGFSRKKVKKECQLRLIHTGL